MLFYNIITNVMNMLTDKRSIKSMAKQKSWL